MSVEDKTPGRRGGRGAEGRGICWFDCTPAGGGKLQQRGGTGDGKYIGLQAVAGLGDPESRALVPGSFVARDSV